MSKPNCVVRAIRVTTGMTILPIGVALVAFRGPGIPIVMNGLALLQGENWGKQLFDKVRSVALLESQPLHPS